MSYTYHGTNGIIALPGRSISTFPSGLVRVDRTYAVRADRASAVRREFAAGNLLPFDDGTPAIDGLYIFPEPQETRRDDGFVEFRVSAYGRTSTTGSQRPEFLRGSVFGLNFSFSQIIIENCLPSSTALRDLLESPPVELRFEIDPQNNPDPNVGDILRLVPIPKLSEVRQGISLGGATILIGGLVFTASYGGIIIERSSINFGIYQTAYIYASENPVIASSSSRNFGFFTEFTTTYEFDGSPIAITAFAGRWKINGVLV
jgi:hypothetical protein